MIFFLPLPVSSLLYQDLSKNLKCVVDPGILMKGCFGFSAGAIFVSFLEVFRTLKDLKTGAGCQEIRFSGYGETVVCCLFSDG